MSTSEQTLRAVQKRDVEAMAISSGPSLRRNSRDASSSRCGGGTPRSAPQDPADALAVLSWLQDAGAERAIPDATEMLQQLHCLTVAVACLILAAIQHRRHFGKAGHAAWRTV